MDFAASWLTSFCNNPTVFIVKPVITKSESLSTDILCFMGRLRPSIHKSKIDTHTKINIALWWCLIEQHSSSDPSTRTSQVLQSERTRIGTFWHRHLVHHLQNKPFAHKRKLTASVCSMFAWTILLLHLLSLFQLMKYDGHTIRDQGKKMCLI